MARVDWAIPCKFAEESSGLGTIVGAGIDTTTVAVFPATVGFMLAIRLIFTDADYEDEHTLTMKLLDPSLEEVGALSTSFRSEPNPDKREGWEGNLLIPAAVRFEVSEEGPYSLVIALDDKTEKTIPIHVIGP